MKLNIESLKNKEFYDSIGVSIPSYDVEKVAEKTKEAPKWVHFGIGNIFRVFIGGIADGMLENGSLDTGITCVETFDYEIVDKLYAPYDNLALSVILYGDGHRDYRVLGSMSETVKADCSDTAQWERLKEVFTSPSLQMVSFTITEKGYALKGTDGEYLKYIKADIDNGPDKCTSAMAIVTAMLYERFKSGKTPVALVSMDNCSQNGSHLRESVLTMADEWKTKGYVTDDFINYVSDESVVAFPWTMIDKITPRPSDSIMNDLENMGIDDMSPVITSKRTYIAPFINAENPQYLVIEDNFPNGRPELEKGKGVYMGSRETVNLSERMKVTALLNPVHSACGPLGVVLGEEYFAHMLNTNPTVMKMAKMVCYDEGMKVISDPVILSPEAFATELFEDRFPNEYLMDTNLRLSTDVSQGVGVRFGETIKSYVKKYGTAESLVAVPLGIAGWLRYMMGVDDFGNRYELAPDPMNDEITEALASVKIGHPDTLTNQLHSILSNEKVFFTDLYKAGVGEKIEGYFREMISGFGATKATIEKYIK